MVLRTIRVEIVDFQSNSSPRARIPRTARVARGVREMRARGDFFFWSLASNNFAFSCLQRFHFSFHFNSGANSEDLIASNAGGLPII